MGDMGRLRRDGRLEGFHAGRDAVLLLWKYNVDPLRSALGNSGYTTSASPSTLRPACLPACLPIHPPASSYLIEKIPPAPRAPTQTLLRPVPLLPLHHAGHLLGNHVPHILILVVKRQLLARRDVPFRKERNVVDVRVGVVAAGGVDLEVGLAGVVDEARGAADVHAVDDVFVGVVRGVAVEGFAGGGELDGVGAGGHLGGVPFDLVGVQLEEFFFGEGRWLFEFVEVHKVVAFVRVAGFAAEVGFVRGDYFAAVGVDELAFLKGL